jgi:hypothetical protein
MATMGDAFQLTFILANVLEGKLVAVVLPLHDAHLAKSSLADHSQQAEVVEVDLVGKDYRFAI